MELSHQAIRTQHFYIKNHENMTPLGGKSHNCHPEVAYRMGDAVNTLYAYINDTKHRASISQEIRNPLTNQILQLSMRLKSFAFIIFSAPNIRLKNLMNYFEYLTGDTKNRMIIIPSANYHSILY